MAGIRGLGAVLLAVACGLMPGGRASAIAAVMPEAFTGCTIYHDADQPPIRGGTMVVDGNKVAALGPDAEVQVPEGATLIPCNGAAILPGFQNSHVHFTEPHWADAARADQEALDQHLVLSYVRYGFVSLVDTGSDPVNTEAIMYRTPLPIRTTGAPFVPTNGTPFYVVGFKFPELTNAEQARAAVNAALDGGRDAIKLMTVPLTRDNPLPEIPLDVVKAATEAAHAHGKLAMAHPTNRRGVELAADGGVDVLLHTAPIGGPWDEALVKRMVAANMSLTPTLALWDYEAAKTNDPGMAEHFRKVSAQQVSAFAKAGGRVLFGTDVGYMTQYDPTPEYVAMQAAGLAFPQILASLTTAPAEVFEKDRAKGTLAVGQSATFVMVNGDPAEDIRRLAQVRRVYREGFAYYRRQP